jgi:hypothetical protein
VAAQQGVEGFVVPVQGGGDERLVIERGNDPATLVVRVRAAPAISP